MLEAVLIHRAWQGIASFAYDDADRVSEVATLVNGNLTSVLHDLEFEPFGPRKTAAYGPGGLTDTRTYDHRYLLDNWTLGSLIDYTHVFNGDENLVSRKIGVNDDRIFDYDAAHRLVLAQAPALWGEGTACGHQTYTYDANGNRTCKNDKGGSSTDTYDYVTGDRLYSSQSAGEFKYEADGLIADDGNHTYVYDAADRLVSVDPDAFVPTATYTYDGNGRRVSKTTYGPGGRTTWFLYAPDGTLLTEMIPAEGTGTDYIHVASGPLARVDWSGLPGIDPEGVSSGDAIESIDSPGPVEGLPSESLYFFHNDHMGTPLAITDVNGDLVWRVEYKPFGDLYDQSVSKVVNNLRFSGQYHDAESSLYQNWYRYYSPRLGRYMEPDPIGILSDTNVYRYAWDNPITYGDSTGLAACKKECGVRTPPKYDHSGVIPDFTVFTFTASFLNDSKHDPTCCEVRQYIQWNRTLAPDGALFKPPDDKPYTWYEDRGASDKRYGHRTGLHSAPSPIDRYRGDDYFGLDQPQSFPPGFVTKFRLAVVDVCNGGRWVWAGPPALTVYGSGN